MGLNTKRRFSVLAACLLAIAAVSALWFGAISQVARADGGWNSSPITDAAPSELQLRIEQSAAAYNEAVAKVEELEAQAQQCQASIDQLEAELPAAQDAAYEAIRADYKFRVNRGSLVELIVSADSFESFISMVSYLTSVEDYNTARIDALAQLSAELAAQSEALASALDEANAQKDAAEVALAEAIEARKEAQRKAMEEQARAAAAAAAAAQAQVAAAAATDYAAGEQQDPVPQTDGQAGSDQAVDEGVAPEQAVYEDEPQVETESSQEYYAEESYEQPAADAASVSWDSDKSAFVDEWGARIDSYLSGGELEGYGSTFASAAWDYGVDPRWSPAISTIESSQGSVCFLPHNAWGWGDVSWDSWEEAIYDQVEGLARGYGSTLDYEDAQKYCPPTADEWYDAVSSQMDQI